MIPIETRRLRLRELTEDDAAFALELLNEPAFLTNIGDKQARDLDGARRYLANGPIASYARHGHGLWHVALKDGGEAVGICGLLRRDGLDAADVGYAILQRHWRRGYAAEAAAASLAYGFDVLKLPRILAITRVDNDGSQRVLEKIGLRFERRITLPGQTVEDCLYGAMALAGASAESKA